jgi:UDP-N-acetylmuramate: L-alanyl-gamma-D-glutamyl-meso-diaminopimelate ligase
MKIEFDYMVGAKIDGFENMFKLTKKNKIIILEGDEYLSSTIDPTPKFHKYNPDVAVLTGISWDHINVFKTFDIYVEQFKLFIEMVKEKLIYFEDDNTLKNLVLKSKSKAKFIAYNTPAYEIINNRTIINGTELKVFGNHNMQNIKAAMEVCKILKIDEKSFLKNISNFEGAERRLEIVKKVNSSILFRDFAHSPSKLKATINAVKKQFKKRRLIACMELNTFSSLNKVFLSEYKNCMDEADIAIIYYNPKNIQAKKLEKISDFDIIKAFSNKNINIFNNSAELEKFIRTHEFTNTNLLMMSSGNFDNIKIENLINYSFKFN